MKRDIKPSPIIRPLISAAILAALIAAPSMASAKPLPLAVNAQAEQEAETDQAALYDAAYKMARLQQGEPEFSDELKTSMAAQIRTAYAQVPEFAAIEEVSPGFVDAVVDGIIPIIVKQTVNSYPALYARLASFYAENMDLEEIQAATEFFATDSYSTIRESAENNLDISGILSDIGEEGDGDLSTDDLNKLVEDSVTKSAGGWNKQVRIDLLKFVFTPAGRTMTSLRAARNQIEADWANESSPEEDLELEQAIEKVILDYTQAE